MIADSSVWVDFLRGTRNAQSLRLKSALERDQAVSLVAPVLQEILQGANGLAQCTRWEAVLEELPLLVPEDMWAACRSAAMLYVRCRGAGYTIRSPNDCLIAVTAIEFDLPVLHRDRDFLHIAQIEPRMKIQSAQSN